MIMRQGINADRWASYIKTCNRIAWDLDIAITEENGRILLDGELVPETTRYPWLAAYRVLVDRWEAAGHRFRELH